MGSASAEPISFLLAVRHRAPLVLTLDHKTKLNPPRARGGAGSWLPRPRLFFACADLNLARTILRQPRNEDLRLRRFYDLNFVRSTIPSLDRSLAQAAMSATKTLFGGGRRLSSTPGLASRRRLVSSDAATATKERRPR